MKKFVPYYDGVLDKILPEDQLVPYQVGWAEYVAVPEELKGVKASNDARAVNPGAASTHHPAANPTDPQGRR